MINFGKFLNAYFILGMDRKDRCS